MGRRGPAPEPTESKRARGETRPGQLNALTPQPKMRKPVMPKGMSEVARRTWRHVVREMPVGVIVRVDAHALRIYCEAVSRYVQAQELYEKSSPMVRQGGVVITDEDGRALTDDRGRVQYAGGYVAKNPLHQVVRDNADQVRQWARELGLTPSARAGLQIEVGRSAAGIAADLGPPPRLRSVS